MIDYNKLQSDDRNDAIMRLEPLAAKWRAFGWAVAEIDGHDIPAILDAFRRAGATRRTARRDHRPHHQGQGRALHGKHSRLAWQREVHPRPGRRSTRALGADAAEMKELLDV